MNQKRRGNIVIFAVLLTSGLLVIAVSIANLVIPEFQSSRAITEGVNAFYAAESCLENGLMQYIRQTSGVTTDINSTLPAWARTLSNTATCEIGTNKTADSFQVTGLYRKARQSLSVEKLDPCPRGADGNCLP